MDKMRFLYSKVGKAKYISHLDLMAAMRRAMLRAGVDLKYSEGFNPHPYMSVALPLQVGCGSVCELMDVRLEDGVQTDGIADRINASMPEGLNIREVYTPAKKFNFIEWIGISGRLYYDRGAPADAVRRLAERFAEDCIIISKKTKRGESNIDISPFIRDVSVTGDFEIMMSARISAQNPSLSPDNILNALTGKYGDLAPDYADFIREGFYDSDMMIFR